MHRQRKLELAILRCRPTQIRYAATATKEKQATWIESTNHEKWSRTTDRGSQPSETFSNAGNTRWPIHDLVLSQKPSSGHTFSSTMGNDLKSLPRDFSAPASLPSQSDRMNYGPGRRIPRILLDPPSAGLEKWSRRKYPSVAPGEQAQRIIPKTSNFYRPDLRKLDRDVAPHQVTGVNQDVVSRQGAFKFPDTRWQRSDDQRWRGREESYNAQRSLSDRDRRTFDTSSSHPRRDVGVSRRDGEQRSGRTRSAYSASDVAVISDVKDKWSRTTSRIGHLTKDSFKNRGSLLHRNSEDVIASYSKWGSHRSTKEDTRIRKHRHVKDRKAKVDVIIPSAVSVGTLARLLGVRLDRLQEKMRQAGMVNEMSYDHILTSDYAALLSEEFGRNPVVSDEAAFDIYPPTPHPEPLSCPPRPPIVTIMGHVDHGKTTLLDTLRSSSVAKEEAGGITQHIGAFSVPVPRSDDNASGLQTITFLDTPGHAAFSAMRARGASVTDIVVLVVAADDGIMPQTREVLELVRKDQGKIGLVVAINKVDKPGVDVERVKRDLLSENIQLEYFGGDVPSVEVSGLTGYGLDNLVETLSAMAELQDLRAEGEGPVHGHVLESKVRKGLGPIATILVLRGRLTIGSHILCGTSYAKVRLMHDSAGNVLKNAYPGMAVTVSGWKTLPNAGDEVLQGSEADVKKAVANRLRKVELQSTLVDIDAINAYRREERERKELPERMGQVLSGEKPQGPRELRLVIKGDVSGSVEAVAGAVEGIGNKEAVVKVVSTGVGDVSESDVMMAKAAGGMIVAFSVAISRSVEAIAGQDSVPIYSSSIIYRVMEDIKQRVIALLPTTKETKVTGEARVLQLFDIHLKQKQIRKIAGCRVINGVLEKTKHARIVRDGRTVYQGMFDTMRHLKKDTTEIRKGLECGLSFNDFDDLREGDLIQVYEVIEKSGVL